MEKEGTDVHGNRCFRLCIGMGIRVNKSNERSWEGEYFTKWNSHLICREKTLSFIMQIIYRSEYE